jgi:hypothetical protein
MVGKAEELRPLGRIRYRWEDNIKEVRWKMEGRGLDSSSSGRRAF